VEASFGAPVESAHPATSTHIPITDEPEHRVVSKGSRPRRRPSLSVTGAADSAEISVVFVKRFGVVLLVVIGVGRPPWQAAHLLLARNRS
jgi:hypothetical protein